MSQPLEGVDSSGNNRSRPLVEIRNCWTKLSKLLFKKYNGLFYYYNDDNITQQRCDQINLLGRSKGDKYYEHRLDARIDISDCWCVA